MGNYNWATPLMLNPKQTIGDLNNNEVNNYNKQ